MSLHDNWAHSTDENHDMRFKAREKLFNYSLLININLDKRILWNDKMIRIVMIQYLLQLINYNTDLLPSPSR